MWADNETTEDLLGFRIHADLLIDVINDETVLPVTIGVFGDWGSGKSSILQIVREELSGEGDDLKDGTLVLYFNGWLFEGYDDAKAALLESIIEKFAKHKTIGNKVKDSASKLLRSVNWMRVIGMGFKRVVIPGATAYMSGGLSLLPQLTKALSQFKAEDLAEKLTSEGTEDFLNGILQKNSEEEVTLIREFRDDFKKMIDKSEIKKLVVIIDDLDRCMPERLIENLEAIKLFLNVEKTAFIIGADPRIVRFAIEDRYKTDRIENSDDPDSRNKRIVNDYLEKLIQIPYILPKLSDSEVETYMTLLFCKRELGESFTTVLNSFKTYREKDRYGTFGFGDLEAIISPAEYQKMKESVSLIASLAPIITEGLNGNPRQIKRFLNTFTLRNRLVKVAKINDFQVDILAKLMVLEYSSPALFRKIYEWQITQKGEAEEIKVLEDLVENKDFEGIKDKFGGEWSSEKLIRWISIEPKLSNVDLRDYYWISRDQLTGSISGASLIPPHIRTLFKQLVEHGSGAILSSLVSQQTGSSLTEFDREMLYSLLEKELSKSPDEVKTHEIFVELISQNIAGGLESYTRAIKQCDHSKIPFSLRQNYTLAEQKNKSISSIYTLFNSKSQIYKALHQKS